jgi:hypothetical protein
LNEVQSPHRVGPNSVVLVFEKMSVCVSFPITHPHPPQNRSACVCVCQEGNDSSKSPCSATGRNAAVGNDQDGGRRARVSSRGISPSLRCAVGWNKCLKSRRTTKIEKTSLVAVTIVVVIVVVVIVVVVVIAGIVPHQRYLDCQWPRRSLDDATRPANLYRLFCTAARALVHAQFAVRPTQ